MMALERACRLFEQFSLVPAIVRWAILRGFAQPLEVAEIAQGTVRLPRGIRERQVSSSNRDAQGLQRGQYVAVTLAFDPKAMQLFASQCPKTSPLS